MIETSRTIQVSFLTLRLAFPYQHLEIPWSNIRRTARWFCISCSEVWRLVLFAFAVRCSPLRYSLTLFLLRSGSPFEYVASTMIGLCLRLHSNIIYTAPSKSDLPSYGGPSSPESSTYQVRGASGGAGRHQTGGTRYAWYQYLMAYCV